MSVATPTEATNEGIYSEINISVIKPEALKALVLEVQSLRLKVSALETELANYREYNEYERSIDRQRISNIERSEPQPLQRNRGELLRSLLIAHSGKMLESEALRLMNIDKASFSRLLKTIDDIEVKLYYRDKRKKILVLK